MTKSVAGLFSNQHNADKAVSKLLNEGFSPNVISVVSKEFVSTDEKSTAENVSEGTTKGATIGGIAGLIAGVAGIAVPGLLAPLVFVGPVASALGLTGAVAAGASGAIMGGLAGGLVGALVGLGFPKEEAEIYETRINEGDIMLVVEVDDSNKELVTSILEESGAARLNTLNA